jgi:hypothetical protein
MTTIFTDIYNALMAGVNSAVLTMPIAWENQDEDPSIPMPFCQVSLLPYGVEPASLGPEGYNKHTGTVLLTLHYPLGEGPMNALAVIDQVATALKRGTTLTSGTAIVTIESVWRPPPAYGKAWVKFPVQIRWRCHAGS